METLGQLGHGGKKEGNGDGEGKTRGQRDGKLHVITLSSVLQGKWLGLGTLGKWGLQAEDRKKLYMGLLAISSFNVCR